MLKSEGVYYEQIFFKSRKSSQPILFRISKTIDEGLGKICRNKPCSDRFRLAKGSLRKGAAALNFKKSFAVSSFEDLDYSQQSHFVNVSQPVSFTFSAL